MAQKPKRQPRNCLSCNREIYAPRINQKFCDMKCKKQFTNALINFNCQLCNKSFSDYRERTFCSQECYNKSKEVLPINCPTCNISFAPRPNQAFCSTKCSGDARKSKREHTCQFCNKKFKNRKKGKKFCSNECYYNSKRKFVEIECLNCEKTFEIRYGLREQKFCGQKCMGEFYSQQTETHTTPCKNCEKEFEQSVNKEYQKEFCSRKCSGEFKSHEEVEIICKNCKNEFTVPWNRRNQQFCNKSCANSGEFNVAKNPETAKKISDIMAEKIVNGEFPYQYGYESGYFESKKCNIKMFYRSSYELKACEMFEKNPNVIFFNTEPLAIKYVFENQERNYIPDFIVQYKDGTEKIIEIKPKCFTNNKQVLAKEEYAKLYCEKRNMIYEIYTENDLHLL